MYIFDSNVKGEKKGGGGEGAGNLGRVGFGLIFVLRPFNTHFRSFWARSV